jgi:hydrogenase nickel incorporation protein HypA/HybF
MHEMSIALNILEIVERSAQANGAAAVTGIFIEVGTLAGVMIPALEFGLEIAKKDTSARDAGIRITEIEGRGECPECGHTYPMTFPIEPCPACKNSYLKMIAGDELRVREIEVEKDI